MESSKPKRQEQETAREEVTEVAKDVLRMELPISMPGLGHVNCYALIDSEGAALIDPGLPTGSSFAALKQRLGQAGGPLAIDQLEEETSRRGVPPRAVA